MFHQQCAITLSRHIFVAGLASTTLPKSRSLEFVLFSVKLFYCCLKTRISGCYVKYANRAVSHLQIRQRQHWKTKTISVAQAFKEAI